MATEQAHEAATATSEAAAAAIADAGNTASAADEKATLLQQMSAPEPPPAEEEQIVDEGTDEAPPAEAGEEVAEAEPDEAAPDEEHLDPEEDPHLDPKTRNIRLHIPDNATPEDRRVLELQKKGLTPTEAYRAVYGNDSRTEKQTPAQEAAPDPVHDIETEIARLDSESAELDTQIADAQFDNEARAELQKKQRDIDRKIGRLEARKEALSSQRQTDEQQSFQTEVTNAFNRAVAEFPDAFTKDEVTGEVTFNPNTRLGRKAKSQFLLTQGLPAVKAPDFLYTLVEDSAETIGYEKPRPGATPQKTQKPTPGTQTPPARRTARPVAAGGVAPSTTPDPTRISQIASTGSAAEALAALRELGTPFR